MFYASAASGASEKFHVCAEFPQSAKAHQHKSKRETVHYNGCFFYEGTFPNDFLAGL